jgi:hypothetical protein
MLPTPVGHCRSKWFGENTFQHPTELAKRHPARNGGHGFPGSGLCRSEPRIIDVIGKAWRSRPGRWFGLLSVLACIAMTGCAGVSSGGQTSNTNPNPNQNPPSAPTDPGLLSVAPTALNFGTVALGGSVKLTGMLTAGSSDINVTSAAWSGQGYSISGIAFPVTVTAGKGVNYTVTFTPQVVGDSAGSISFVSDGSDSPLGQTLDGSGSQSRVHTVGLSWDASRSSVIGYNVYRATQPGGPYQLLTSSPQLDTSYTDSAVLGGTTYYYVATAVDSNHAESNYSNQTQAVIP